MSKYEKHSWCIGIIGILGTVLVSGLLIIYGSMEKMAADVLLPTLFFTSYCCVSGVFCNFIAPFGNADYWDRTEDEKRLSDKATAWVFYGLVIIFTIVIFFTPKIITIAITRNAIGCILMFIGMLLLGVQSLLLVRFLRHSTKQTHGRLDEEFLQD